MESVNEQEAANKLKSKRRRVTRAQRIAEIEAELEQLKAREREEQQQKATRCKVIVGEKVIEAMMDDPQLADVIKKLVNARVTRESDRKAIAHLL